MMMTYGAPEISDVHLRTLLLMRSFCLPPLVMTDSTQNMEVDATLLEYVL